MFISLGKGKVLFFNVGGYFKFVMKHYYCREMSTSEPLGELNRRLVKSNWRMESERLKIV